MKLKNRVFGLDLLRSVAILIVVLGHSSPLISGYFKSFPYLPSLDGVDLFFVLSGFLVGTIIIKIFDNAQSFEFKDTLNFLVRRWFRTLPNYFLFLTVNIVLIYFGLIKGCLNHFFITYVFFFQNFFKPFDFLFWESWSLSVEEWFYLLFPFAMMAIYKFFKYRIKVKNIILTGIVIFIVCPLIYRISQYDTFKSWDLYYRKLVLTRLDTIGFGLLAAYLYYYFLDFWRKYRKASFLFVDYLPKFKLIIL
ncbi:MAG: acyltransferase [Bacteroidia bacterium]|nr:acyltransferase [Bacteroidia bacterium]